MTGSPPPRNFEPPRIFEQSRDFWPAMWLGLAMLGAAITEGIGLVLIAPMLMALGVLGDGHGPVVAALAPLGLRLAPAPMLGLFVLLVLLRGLIMHGRTMAGRRFEAGLVDGLRARAWSALLHCDWRILSAMRQSKNASLLISDIDRVGGGVNHLISALSSAVTLIGVGLAGLAISAPVTLAAAVAGLLVLLAQRGMRSKARLLGEQLSAAYMAIYAAVAEGLGALRVIKSFGKERETVAQFAEGIVQLRAAERAFLNKSGWAQIALQSGGALLLAALLWLATERWQVGPATVLPLVALFVRALPLLGALQGSWQQWAHERPAMTATLALIAEAEAAREPDAPGIAAPRLSREIALRGVSVHFASREQSALEAVSLTIPAGKITALCGPSGAGKSTLADLAGGLLAPDSGQVMVDGQALEGGLRQAWRGHVAYVQQEPVLFAGTIRSNLLWADPAASEEDLRRVLADASAQFVEALPEGLDTPVGDSGRQLSGGERQRIVLARALLRKPALLILDEATSALDRENEEAIAAAITRLRGRLTILIIGHRGALQGVADQVLTLEQGQIVAS
jgi:ATP-binding cassette, subfamily C, bacterial